MPLSDHVDLSRPQKADSPAGRIRAGRRPVTVGRRGISIDLDATSTSILTPLLSQLPSISSITALRSFLPKSPTKPGNGFTPTLADDARATWQRADLGDGRGDVPLLLITSKHHALQIFTLDKNAIPDDPHVQEVFPPPEELFNLPTIQYDAQTVRTALFNIPVDQCGSGGVEHVLQARLLEKGALWKDSGPLAALVTCTSPPGRQTTQGALGLVLISLRTGLALRRVSIGPGTDATVKTSARAMIVAVSHPSPTIHILDPFTLLPSHGPITDLPCDTSRNCPTFAVSGRLLAFTTSEQPRTPGADGLGSLVTLESPARFRAVASEAYAGGLSDARIRAPGSSAQGALLTSAVEIGGGVARGVWEGIKMGARAAGQARNGRLARSAPSESSKILSNEGDVDGLGDETRSLGESSLLEEPMSGRSTATGGEWIKVVDLFPQRASEPQETIATQSSEPSSSSAHPAASGFNKPVVIAHYRLSSLFSFSPALSPQASRLSRQPSNPGQQTVSHLKFAPSGTQLFAASSDGRAFHLVDLHPAGAIKPGAKTECKGEAWHLYELRRGTTAATVNDVAWDKDGRWIGVGTGRGTIHIFPIRPSGGPVALSTHASCRHANPSLLCPLSTIVHPIARLRPEAIRLYGSREDQALQLIHQTPGLPTFMDFRQDPLHKDIFHQDVAVYRPSTALMERIRLSTRTNAQLPVQQSKRHSALTAMMRHRASFTSRGDLSVDQAVKARWLLPLGAAIDDPICTLDQVNRIASVSSHHRFRSLAHAEIQTYSINHRILPCSIYLSRQMDFFAAKAIDEYSPLSILDIDARICRLCFRHEVEARPGSPDVKSFDEPLLSALHTVIESPPTGQIPGLPNGYPSRNKWRSSNPISHVASGLGEGMDRVRREYARAQHSRIHRRASEAAANQLSFEEDAVFASGDDSSPSSGVLPESSVAEEDTEEADGWGEGWEEEYRRAVEDDGGPDDLVMGLLDEEEEERRRQKSLARQYAK